MEAKQLKSKVVTGVDGLDLMLSGGLPRKRTVLVTGGPGSGKTILCAQFLHTGITKEDEKGIYVSLDYSKETFIQDMLQFGWDFTKLEKDGKFVFVEGSAIRKVPHTQSVQGTLYSSEELSFDDVVDLIALYADKIDAKRVVIDSLSALIFRFPEQVQRRAATLNLTESLASLNVTTLMISEATMYDMGREISPEEFLSDGVINMFMQKDGSRAIQISKMRGLHVDNKPRPYSIVDKGGIDVFPNESVFT